MKTTNTNLILLPFLLAGFVLSAALSALFALVSIALNLVVYGLVFLFKFGWLALVVMGCMSFYEQQLAGAFLLSFFGLLWFAVLINKGWIGNE